MDIFQIPVVADLPVGRNLQDHMMFPAMIHVNESISGSDWVYDWWSQLQYSLFRAGQYSRYKLKQVVGNLVYYYISDLFCSF